MVYEGKSLSTELGGDNLEGDLCPRVHRVGDEEATQHGHQGREPGGFCCLNTGLHWRLST